MIRHLLLAAALLAGTAHAADEEPIEAPWEGDIELGFYLSTGSSRGQLWLGELDMEKQYEDRRYEVALDGRYEREKHEEDSRYSVSSARYNAMFKAETYLIPDADYAFGMVKQRHNRFGPNRRTDVLITGLGHTFDFGNDNYLSLEAGPGMRWRLQHEGRTQREGVVYLAQEMAWQLNPYTSLHQKASVEANSEVGVEQFEVSVKNKLSGALALKIGVLASRTNRSPAEAKESDTETRLTLVYHF